MRKSFRTAAALLVASVLIGAPAVAYAEEFAPDVVVSEVSSDESTPEVVVEETSEEVLDEQRGQGHDPVTICHKPGTNAQKELTFDDDGWKAHIDHGDTEGVCPPLFEPYTERAWWLLPDTWNYDVTPTYQAAIFPQNRIDIDSVIPCERWVQDDTYAIENEKDEKIFKSLGDVLTRGEDSKIYLSHVFIKGPECEPEIPEQPSPEERSEILEDLPSCEYSVVTITENFYETPYVWNGKEWVLGEEVLVNTVVTEREANNEDYNSLECGIIPGNISAVCVGDVPFFSYSLDAPQEGDVTIVFSKDDLSYEAYSGPIREGQFLWPGAQETPTQQWPGWELQATEYVNVGDENFGWTRDGVTVTFSINPEYSTTVDYPEASAECANPPVLIEKPSVTVLPETGASPMVPFLIFAAVTIGLGLIALLVMWFINRRKANIE